MSWEQYYEKNAGRPLRPLYKQAIQFLDPKATVAIDLGCGIGTEVLDLLKRNLEVHALDQECKALEIVRAQAEAFPSKIHLHHSSLENWKDWQNVDFLFAYHSFPFCQALQFKSVVEKAISSVKPGGIFAVSFFGPEDQWAQEGHVVGITAEEVQSQLRDFSVLHFDEIKKVGPTALQGDKMWHVIEVIARRVQ